MNRYTVVWVPSAGAELADLWVASSERNAIAQAADGIDVALRNFGADAGIELSEGLFALEYAPLRVLFETLPANAMIRILKVKRS